jgi:hypothetical protein
MHSGILSGNSSDESFGLVPSHPIRHPSAWRIGRSSRSDGDDAAQSNEDLDSSAIIDDNDGSSSTSPVTGDLLDADRNQFLKHLDAKLRALQFKRLLLAQYRKKTLSESFSHDLAVARAYNSTSPRTTRQRMLETELTKEIRREMLNERKQNGPKAAKAVGRRPTVIGACGDAYPDYTLWDDYNLRGW